MRLFLSFLLLALITGAITRCWRKSHPQAPQQMRTEPGDPVHEFIIKNPMD